MIIMKEKIQDKEVALERSMSGEDISYVRKKNEQIGSIIISPHNMSSMMTRLMICIQFHQFLHLIQRDHIPEKLRTDHTLKISLRSWDCNYPCGLSIIFCMTNDMTIGGTAYEKEIQEKNKEWSEVLSDIIVLWFILRFQKDCIKRNRKIL